jgi:hypothetical protein
MATARATHRPGRRLVRCTGPCQELREVSAEYAARIRSGRESGICRACSRPVTRPAPTEADRVYWLIQFGAPAAEVRALTAAGYVIEHGLPDQLREIAEGLCSPSSRPF